MSKDIVLEPEQLEKLERFNATLQNIQDRASEKLEPYFEKMREAKKRIAPTMEKIEQAQAKINAAINNKTDLLHQTMKRFEEGYGG